MWPAFAAAAAASAAICWARGVSESAVTAAIAAVTSSVRVSSCKLGAAPGGIAVVLLLFATDKLLVLTVANAALDLVFTLLPPPLPMGLPLLPSGLLLLLLELPHRVQQSPASAQNSSHQHIPGIY